MDCLPKKHVITALILGFFLSIPHIASRACDCANYYPNTDCCIDGDWDFPHEQCTLNCYASADPVDCYDVGCYVSEPEEPGLEDDHATCSGYGDKCATCVVNIYIRFYECTGLYRCRCLTTVWSTGDDDQFKCTLHESCKCVEHGQYRKLIICEKNWF